MLDKMAWRVRDIRATGRESGGARVTLYNSTWQPGNSDLISFALIPRTSGFRGLLKWKSYQIMHPSGRKTRSISAASCILTFDSRTDVNTVDWTTKSNSAFP